MFLKSHKPGANITIMNTLSSTFKDDKGKSHEGLILVYKDLDTGLLYKEEIIDPEYTFYVANPDSRVNYNRSFIEAENCHPVTCPHRKVEGKIAELTGNKIFYNDNITSGNPRENQRLHAHPDIFRSDMNIEDYYRFEFNKTYKNDICKITRSFLDIEVDGTNQVGDFPQPGEVPINATTLIFQDLNQAYIFLLETKSNPLIQEFKKSVEDGSIFPELKSFVVNAVNGPESAARFGIDKLDYNFLFYKEEDEIKLIKDIFAAINNFKPDFLLVWNMSFDIPYIIERIKVLGYKPEDIICNPDFNLKFCNYYVDTRMLNEFAERGDFALISSYTCFIDQMIQYASRRKGRTKPLSFNLDYTGETVAKVKKLDYKHITTNITELPFKDYKTFVFYNIMDVIVQLCIENKTGDLDYMVAKAISNNTRYSKVHRQTVYLANRGCKEFDNSGFIMGNNVNKFNEKPETKFPGAYVADPLRVKDTSKLRLGGIPISVFDNLNDFDYASLYPSNIRQFNIAANTQIGMIIIPEQISAHENRQHDPAYSRSGQFLEDFRSHQWLEIGTRWFNLADFTELTHDVDEFFHTVMMPNFGTRGYNRNGMIEPMFFGNKRLVTSPMYFNDDIRDEKYNDYDAEAAKRWRENAINNPNQLFR